MLENKNNCLTFLQKYQLHFDVLTLKVSFDDGMTWPKEHWILFDQYRSAGYSCITSIDENSIGILYESSQSDLAFIKINLIEILK